MGTFPDWVLSLLPDWTPVSKWEISTVAGFCIATISCLVSFFCLGVTETIPLSLIWAFAFFLVVLVGRGFDRAREWYYQTDLEGKVEVKEKSANKILLNVCLRNKGNTPVDNLSAYVKYDCKQSQLCQESCEFPLVLSGEKKCKTVGIRLLKSERLSLEDIEYVSFSNGFDFYKIKATGEWESCV